MRLTWLVGFVLIGAGAINAQEFDLGNLECPGGQCVKLNLCADGTFNTDGTNIIDIRFNEDNICVDYLMKCCPYGEEEGDNPTTVVPDQPNTIDNDGNSGSSKKPGTVSEKCGLRNIDGIAFQITGASGGESEYGEFPWMAAVLKKEKFAERVINTYQCGGSLINPSVLLTVAHCVHHLDPSVLKVRLGEWDTQTRNEPFDYQDRNVRQVVAHESFIPKNLFNDIALLLMDEPAQLMETVGNICLPPPNYDFDHSRCFVSGWGKDVFGKGGKYQVILKKIELPVVPRDACEGTLQTTRLSSRFRLDKSFICAGGEQGRDACTGDGGSPLMCPIPGTVNRYYQAGMVAWGIGCAAAGIPGVYVNVPMFRDWIDQQVARFNVSQSSYVYT